MEIKTWIFHLISTDNLVKWKLLTFASLSETGKFYVFLFSCSSCAWTFSFIHVVKLLRVFLVCIRLHHKRVFHVLGVFIWILNDKNKDEWNIFDKFSFDLLGKVFLFPKCFFLTRENCNKKFSLKKKKSFVLFIRKEAYVMNICSSSACLKNFVTRVPEILFSLLSHVKWTCWKEQLC